MTAWEQTHSTSRTWLQGRPWALGERRELPRDRSWWSGGTGTHGPPLPAGWGWDRGHKPAGSGTVGICLGWGCWGDAHGQAAGPEAAFPC